MLCFFLHNTLLSFAKSKITQKANKALNPSYVIMESMDCYVQSNCGGEIFARALVVSFFPIGRYNLLV